MDTLTIHQPPARGAKLTMPPVILAPIDLGSEAPLAPAGAGPSRPGPDRTILSARYDHCGPASIPARRGRHGDTAAACQDRPSGARRGTGSRRAAARGAIRVSMTNSFKFLQYGSVSSVDLGDLQRFCRVPSPSTHRHLSCLSLPLCRVKRWVCPAHLPNQFLSRSISPHVLRPSW
jgi:hypothetical protein